MTGTGQDCQGLETGKTIASDGLVSQVCVKVPERLRRVYTELEQHD